MALEFDWLGIADGSTNDSRGLLSLVGIGHNVIIAPTFPHQAQRVLVAIIFDEQGTALSEGTAVNLDFRVTSPSGRTLSANNQTVNIGPNTAPIQLPPDLPSRGFQVVFGLGLQVTEYGVHTVRAAITVGEEELVRTRILHVIRPPEGLLSEAPVTARR
jgi:hypothetical protein